MSDATRPLLLPRRFQISPRVMRYATLASVGALVLSVSLSLFGGLATRDNERSARRTLRLLGSALGGGSVAAATTLGEVIDGDPLLARRLPDRRWLAQGELLLHHGYLFALSATSDEVRAWPWDWGRTGTSAFAMESGELWAHPNERGRWSGTGRAPARDTDPAEWTAQD